MYVVIVIVLFTWGLHDTNIGVLLVRSQPANEWELAWVTGLAPLRKARPWLVWCGHPVGSAVVQISKVAKPPRACRPRPDHDPAMQRVHGAGCNEAVPTPRVANHRLRVCTPGAPRRGCTVHLRQVHPGKNGVIVRS